MATRKQKNFFLSLSLFLFLARSRVSGTYTLRFNTSSLSLSLPHHRTHEEELTVRSPSLGTG